MRVSAVFLSLLLAACAAPPSAVSLDGRTFLSTAVSDDGAPRPLVPGTGITLGFAAGRLAASAGCNTMGAAYRLDGDVLRIDGAAQTEMGCDPDRMDQDEWLFGFLGAGPTVRLEGAALILDGGGTIIRLLDREVAVPDLPLVGPTWTLVSIIDGDVASSVPQGVVATLVFEAGGHVDVRTGCNQGGGSYAVTDGTIALRDVAFTLVLCVDALGQPDARSRVERAVQSVLGRAMTFTIEGGILELRAGAQGLQYGAT